MKPRLSSLCIFVFAVAFVALPAMVSAIPQCSECNCASGCFLKCRNGFQISQCQHYICIDYCFAGKTELTASDDFETYLATLKTSTPESSTEMAPCEADASVAAHEPSNLETQELKALE